MDVLQTRFLGALNNYINMLEPDFDKLIAEYSLPIFVDEDSDRYTLYNGFYIRLVSYSEFVKKKRWFQ